MNITGGRYRIRTAAPARQSLALKALAGGEAAPRHYSYAAAWSLAAVKFTRVKIFVTLLTSGDLTPQREYFLKFVVRAEGLEPPTFAM